MYANKFKNEVAYQWLIRLHNIVLHSSLTIFRHGPGIAVLVMPQYLGFFQGGDIQFLIDIQYTYT